MHKGLSGFGIRIEGDVLEKWTTGFESKEVLKRSCMIQTEEMMVGRLHPIRTVPVLSKHEKGDYFSFSMPFMEGNTGYKIEEGFDDFSIDIRNSFMSRFDRADSVPTFHGIIHYQVSKYPRSVLTEIILDQLKEVGDYYPHGFVHGDFGFANMIIPKVGQIFMIDFTDSFIYSPLMDFATMELSLHSSEAKKHHIDLFKKVESDLGPYKKQKDIVRMCKVLSYTHSEPNEDFKKDVMKKFYGEFV